MDNGELPKSYDPKAHEELIYKLWEGSGAFTPDRRPSTVDRRQPFSVIMPPPNANGALHIGHAVGVTLQDFMTRYHRLKGEVALLLPGADHAGFETQVVFEKKLEKEGQSRFDFDRETLYQKMFAFTQKNKVHMESQLRRLGTSCDWSREKFTLDPDIIQIVYETFKQLYEDGLVYRADGIVNWCPKHQTALSGLEVKYIEQKDPFYYLKYGPFVITTARPETKFGDKYVVVHPDDKRYKKYHHGQQFEVDWINGKITATLIKDSIIDMSFGTGAMTITPWHDAADFALAKKHHLEPEQIIDFRGRLKDIAGPLAGLKINESRPELVKILKDRKLLEKIDENYVHSVATCYKCNASIEPQIRKQWWLKMTENSKFEIRNSKIKEQLGGTYSLRDAGVAAVTSGEVKFVTKKFEKIFLHWMKILEDWNLSRQIVWGIQLPVWYCRPCDKTIVEVPKETTVYAVRHGQAEHNVKKVLNGDPKKTSNLTEIGRKQAQALAKKLAKIQFDHIFVSEMPRTQQTAGIIAESRIKNPPAGEAGQESRIPIHIDKRINDIWVGGLEWQSIDKVRQITDSYTKSVDGSETMADITKRTHAFFDDIIQKYPGKTILVVSSEILLHCLQQTPHQGACEEASDDHPSTGTYRRLVFRRPYECLRCHGILRRDPDVFDTWFSSGQWAFATLMSQRKHQAPSTKHQVKDDFRRFYPTTVMETGWDILFFWVARMIMIGLYKTGQVPFRYVYLHGLVRDKDRQKMSKSKGNVIDPLGVADLYGADAVRMALTFGAAAGNDMAISEEKIRGMRNFANKVWNIGRFVIANRPNSKPEARSPNEIPNSNFKNSKIQSKILKFENSDLKTDADKAMWQGLQKTIKIVTSHIEKFRFHQAAEVLYDFIWHEYADKYIEAAKKQLDDPKLRENTSQLLVISYSLLVKLLHPFMPFVTEALWQELRNRQLVSEPMLISASWPTLGS